MTGYKFVLRKTLDLSNLLKKYGMFTNTITWITDYYSTTIFFGEIEPNVNPGESSYCLPFNENKI